MLSPDPAPRARLRGVLEGTRTEFSLTDRTTLGRHPASVVRISDREVSKEHAAIERDPEGYFLLKDLGSSNGTFVNGLRVREARLKEGDELALGSARLTFHLGEQPSMLTSALSAPGVTVLGAGRSTASILARLTQTAAETEFRPADQISDPAELLRDYEKLRIAHEFHRQVGLERDPKSLLDKILSVAFQLLAADNGVLLLMSPQGQLVPESLKRRDARSTEDIVLSETVLERVMATGEAVLTADAVLDARFSGSESIVAQGIRSAMAVPLLVHGELKGVLFLDTRIKTNAFSEKDLKLLSAVASQAATALHNAELGRKIEVEAIARAELSRFLSPAVAEMVVKGHVELLRQGRLAEVTLLFADIRGFTALAEMESPQELVTMLNHFFTAMASVVFRHEGNLDKFIGDCVMAVWGPPSPHADDPARALRAALQMQEEVAALNRTREAEGKVRIEVGIGVNTGQAVVGYMGSTERHEFTAIGDSVNTASRLCGMARGGEVIVSACTMAQAGSGFEVEALPASRLRGKERLVSVYRLHGLELTQGGAPRP